MTKEVSVKNFEKKIAKMSFEEALSRLEEIVENLSLQKANLDSMVDFYEEANALRQHCSKKLEEAKMKIEIVGQKK